LIFTNTLQYGTSCVGNFNTQNCGKLSDAQIKKQGFFIKERVFRKTVKYKVLKTPKHKRILSLLTFSQARYFGVEKDVSIVKSSTKFISLSFILIIGTFASRLEVKTRPLNIKVYYILYT